MLARLSQKGKGPHANVAEKEGPPKKKLSAVLALHKAADMKVVADQAFTKFVEHTAWIAQLDGDLYALKG